jgi:hypothetical protein
MPPHDSSPIPGHDPDRPRFPTLPIVTPDPPRRTVSEKYGSLFYVGIGGLLVVIALVAWFAWGTWSLRAVWSNVYVLHDAGRSESDRVAAAYTLSRDSRVNQRQLWDISLRRPLPPLARYVVAEALTAEAAVADPRAYGVGVARSEGWPAWLRLLLTRPMAYAAALDLPVDRDSLAELARNPDPATTLWATFALAVGPSGDPESATALRKAATTDTPDRELAALLVKALESPREPERIEALDAATLWLRTHHPEAAKLWNGWLVRDGLLVHRDLRRAESDPMQSRALP